MERSVMTTRGTEGDHRSRSIENDPNGRPSDAIELKFHDTLEEVVALKRILQDFLSEPTPKVASNKEDSSSSPVTKTKRERAHGTAPARSLLLTMASRASDDRAYPIDYDYETEIDGVPAASHAGSQVRTSQGSQRMLRNSLHFEPNFQARMQYYMAKRQLNRAQIQAEVDEKTNDQLKRTPTINQRSKRIQRSVDHLHAWNNDREQKLEELRAAERDREVEEVTGQPKICRVSHRMNQKRKDDLAQCKVEDRLHLLGLIYEYQQEERALRAQRHDSESYKPRLAPHSSMLIRQPNAPTHERLHKLSKKMLNPEPQEQNDESCKRTTKPKEAVEAAIQRLAEIGELYQQKRMEMARQREQQLEEMQTSQKLSTKSRMLAEQARSKSALGNCSHHRKCMCCQQPQRTQRMASRQIDVAEAASIYEKQVQWKQENERRWRAQKKQRDAEDATLEFRNPHYGQAWDTLDCADHDSDVRTCDDANRAFFVKSVRWAGDRDHRLEQERKIWDEIQLRDCTFRPQLSIAPPHSNEAAVMSPRQLAKRGRMAVCQRRTSRANLAPMLSMDASVVSMDDCVEESDGELAEKASPPRRMSARVTFFNDGERMHPPTKRSTASRP